jgi:hypothetical protein
MFKSLKSRKQFLDSKVSKLSSQGSISHGSSSQGSSSQGSSSQDRVLKIEFSKSKLMIVMGIIMLMFWKNKFFVTITFFDIFCWSWCRLWYIIIMKIIIKTKYDGNVVETHFVLLCKSKKFKLNSNRNFDI